MSNLDLTKIFNISYAEKEGDNLTVLLGAIMCFIGLACFISSLAEMLKYSKKTSGELIKSEPSYKTKRGIESVYTNTYVYFVNEEKYRAEIKETQEHDRGYTCDIYYNKDNPELAKTSVSKTLLIVGLLITVLSILTIFRGIQIINSFK